MKTLLTLDSSSQLFKQFWLFIFVLCAAYFGTLSFVYGLQNFHRYSFSFSPWPIYFILFVGLAFWVIASGHRWQDNVITLIHLCVTFGIISGVLYLFSNMASDFHDAFKWNAFFTDPTFFSYFMVMAYLGIGTMIFCFFRLENIGYIRSCIFSYVIAPLSVMLLGSVIMPLVMMTNLSRLLSENNELKEFIVVYVYIAFMIAMLLLACNALFKRTIYVALVCLLGLAVNGYLLYRMYAVYDLTSFVLHIRSY